MGSPFRALTERSEPIASPDGEKDDPIQPKAFFNSMAWHQALISMSDSPVFRLKLLMAFSHIRNRRISEGQSNCMLHRDSCLCSAPQLKANRGSLFSRYYHGRKVTSSGQTDEGLTASQASASCSTASRCLASDVRCLSGGASGDSMGVSPRKPELL